MFSYEEARNFIERRAGLGSVLGLTSMHALMEQLKNPQNDIRIIHIAGTNGKGSTGAYMAAILKEAGLNVGRYCSPAVFHPLECWQYNDRCITEAEYAYHMSQVKDACDIVSSNGIHPTVFEIETALAFVYFKAMEVDVLLLETGLGGETDATNVVANPFACVFTTISRDHMQFLGETLPEIATVKAGIIKPGSKVFSATQESEVGAVIDQRYCEICGDDTEDAVVYVKDGELTFLGQKPGELTFSYKGNTYTTQMSGLYQMKNAALAIEVCDVVLQEWSQHDWAPDDWMNNAVRDDIITRGVQKASWPGRFEVIGREPLLIIDGAHNEDAVKQLAFTIEKSFTNPSLNLIIGILADKEHEKMLEIMMPYANHIYTVTPPNARGLDGKILAEEVRLWHEEVLFCESIEVALNKAISQSEQDGCPILAFGSLSYLGKLKENYKQICESRMKDV